MLLIPLHYISTPFTPLRIPLLNTNLPIPPIINSTRLNHFSILSATTSSSRLHNAPLIFINGAALGSDGDYFSKPNAEDVFETIYDMMHEVKPDSFPKWSMH